MKNRYYPFLVLALLVVCTSISFGQDTAFYRSLTNKKFASFHDGLKAAQILAHDSIKNKQSFEERFQSLKEQHIAAEDWEANPQSPITRGQLSYMFMKALDLEGGLITRIFGISERYAYRELVFIGLIARGNGKRYVRGEELLSILRSAHKYDQEQNQ